MADEDFPPHVKECDCTDPVHGGKLWMCDTQVCEHNKDCECQATFKEHCQYPVCDCDREEEHPKTCRCEVCRFWS